MVDADGNPIRLKPSEGQAHDGRSATDMLESIGPGQTLLADRGYDSDALRQKLADRGAWANVKPMPGRVNIPVISPYLYRFRSLVERFFNKINTSAPSPRASKSTTTTTSRSSNSQQPEFGCGL